MKNNCSSCYSFTVQFAIPYSYVDTSSHCGLPSITPIYERLRRVPINYRGNHCSSNYLSDVKILACLLTDYFCLVVNENIHLRLCALRCNIHEILRILMKQRSFILYFRLYTTIFHLFVPSLDYVSGEQCPIIRSSYYVTLIESKRTWWWEVASETRSPVKIPQNKYCSVQTGF
jgi:hypothetical protein